MRKKKIPSYYDLMRAFMALRDGASDLDLERDYGISASNPDHDRIVNCRDALHEMWMNDLATQAQDTPKESPNASRVD